MTILPIEIRKRIEVLYLQNNINRVDDLSINNITNKFNIIVEYHPIASFAYDYKGEKRIYIKANLPDKLENFYFYSGLVYLMQNRGIIDWQYVPEDVAINLAIPSYMIPQDIFYEPDYIKEISNQFKFPLDLIDNDYMEQSHIAYI